MKGGTEHIMGIGRKIFLGAAVFALPIGVLAYLVVSNINEFINFAQYELMGDAYQRPLESLLRDIQNHQLLLHRCPDNGDCSAQLASLKGAISKELQSLQDVNTLYGVKLQFTADGLAKRKRQSATAENLQNNWRELDAMTSKVEKGKVPPAVDEKYDAVIDIVKTMTTHMGDTSFLILDPDLDTYYFMCDTLVNLPLNQDRLARVTAFGRDAIAQGKITEKERTALAVYAALMQQSDLDVINSNLQTALNEDLNFYGVSPSLQKNLPPAFKEYADAQTKFIEMTNQLAASKTPSISVDDYVAAGVKARNANFHLWDVGIPEEDIMLNARINSYAHRRVMAFVFSGLALLVACLLAYGTMLSITKPLHKLARTLVPGATLLSGSVEQLGEISSKGVQDEAATHVICDELTAHAEDMRKTAGQLQSIVFGSGGASDDSHLRRI